MNIQMQTTEVDQQINVYHDQLQQRMQPTSKGKAKTGATRSIMQKMKVVCSFSLQLKEIEHI